MTHYLVDTTVDFILSIMMRERGWGPDGWRFIEKVADKLNIGPYVQRWRVQDNGAGPEFEGQLVYPYMISRYHENSGIQELQVIGRTIYYDPAEAWKSRRYRLVAVPWSPS
jgi:hypothetical protein